jgi:hypothetical protein
MLSPLAHLLDPDSCVIKIDAIDSSTPPPDSDLFAAYSEHICGPHGRWWNRTLEQCAFDSPPAWCESPNDLMSHLGLPAYFFRIIEHLETNQENLVRFNLILSAASLANAHIITEFPPDVLDELYGRVITSYLAHAHFDLAHELATIMQTTWLGITPSVAGAFEVFARSPDVGPGHRDELLTLIKKRFSTNHGT